MFQGTFVIFRGSSFWGDVSAASTADSQPLELVDVCFEGGKWKIPEITPPRKKTWNNMLKRHSFVHARCEYQSVWYYGIIVTAILGILNCSC